MKTDNIKSGQIRTSVMFSMSFKDALKILNIEDYGERIMKSNSHGELFHCMDYIIIAKVLGDNVKWFREWFVDVVQFVEKNWTRPESIYQHIPKCLENTFEAQRGGKK